ncbi:MAG: primary-amine oxidase [Planctomycetota bacterium]
MSARSTRRLAPTCATFTAYVLVGCATPGNQVPAPARNRYDPLLPHEITAAVGTFRADARCPANVRFQTVVLHEPTKDASLDRAAPGQRQAFLVALDRPAGRTIEAVIDLTAPGVAGAADTAGAAGRVVDWRFVPGVQPAMLNDEYVEIPKLVRADPRWQEAMKRRGVTDLEKVQIDTWAPGLARIGAPDGVRLACVLGYDRRDQINGYCRPIEGVFGLVDLTHRKVLEVRDTGPLPLPLARRNGDLDEASVGTLRTPPRPMNITMPDGASFELDGQRVQWQGWSFHFGMHAREGLVLHEVGYEDGGRVRPVLHRAALSEMVVPYGDPDPVWSWRSAFDVGEYGVGRLCSSLVPGADVPEHATLFGAAFADDEGEPYVQERVVALYERDAGMIWRHWDFDSGRTESRRGRELVISYVATVGNYDYALNWVFRQDGVLRVDIDLTGILLPKGSADTTCRACDDVAVPESERYGHLVDENVLAVNHQHIFCFRLDFDVDGPKNSVSELNVAPAWKPDDPAGNAFVAVETPLADEHAAQRSMNLESARKWKIASATAKNAQGHRTAYALVPGENSVIYARPDSPLRRRARFPDHHVWFTRYHPAEMYAAGAYPNQAEKDHGLPDWTADSEPLDGEDVVLWYTLGVTHTPRTEDWPVMAVHRTGFQLVPHGFFSRNPALDLPAVK